VINKVNKKRKRIGSIVRKARLARGLTQEELARRARVAPNTLAMLERGERQCSMRLLDAVGKQLGIPGPCLLILGSSPGDLPDDSSRRLLGAAQALIRTLVRHSLANFGKQRSGTRRVHRIGA